LGIESKDDLLEYAANIVGQVTLRLLSAVCSVLSDICPFLSALCCLISVHSCLLGIGSSLLNVIFYLLEYAANIVGQVSKYTHLGGSGRGVRE
jgi:hypothetical protein